MINKDEFKSLIEGANDLDQYSISNKHQLKEIRCPKFATSIKEEIEEMVRHFLPPSEPRDHPFQPPGNPVPPQRSVSKGIPVPTTAS